MEAKANQRDRVQRDREAHLQAVQEVHLQAAQDLQENHKLERILNNLAPKRIQQRKVVNKVANKMARRAVSKMERESKVVVQEEVAQVAAWEILREALLVLYPKSLEL